MLALEAALRRLQQFLEDENMLLDKQVFEEGVSAEVALAVTQEELLNKVEMFRKRFGNIISTAYCAFGFRRFNDFWYTNEQEKSWLDLKMINS